MPQATTKPARSRIQTVSYCQPLGSISACAVLHTTSPAYPLSALQQFHNWCAIFRNILDLMVSVHVNCLWQYQEHWFRPLLSLAPTFWYCMFLTDHCIHNDLIMCFPLSWFVQSPSASRSPHGGSTVVLIISPTSCRCISIVGFRIM